LDAHVESALDGITDPVERLSARGRAYIDFGLDHAEQYRVLFMANDAPANFTPERMSEMAGFEHLTENVQQCIDTGAIAPGDPELISVGLWALVHGVTSLLVSRPTFPWPPVESLVDHVMAVYAAGLAAPLPS
jgi:AcrR family transcriptional regulator